MIFSTPGFFYVVAESGGRIVGRNGLDERTILAGIGPITVDPAAQNLASITAGRLRQDVVG